jgi:ornithine carbamoyltransferase
MRNLIQLKDYSKADLLHIFDLADQIKQGAYQNFLSGKTVVLFFPNSSIRTRVTYEKGIHLLGGQSILFDSEVLNKKEKTEDVIGYLNNWADAIIARHNEIELMKELAKYSKVPVINAMAKVNHPCEIISDLYVLSKMRKDYLEAEYLFVGPSGNIGLTWKEASDLLGLSFTQCCPIGYEMKETDVEHNILTAIKNKDIILSDSLGKEQIQAFKPFQITVELMAMANENAIFNPCPPFYRGEEVSSDAIDSGCFVGYEFKKALLEVQQAIIVYNMSYNSK